MPVISGTLLDGAGQPVPGCTISLRALSTTSAVIVTVTADIGTEAGRYRIDAQPGNYAVTLAVDGHPPALVGNIEVRPDSPDGALNDYLRAVKDEDLTTEAMKQFQELASQARESADKARASENGASGSAGAALKSEQAAGSSEKASAESAAAAAGSATKADAAKETAVQASRKSENNAAAAQKSEQAAARSEKASGENAAAAADSATKSEAAKVAAQEAAASITVTEAPEDGMCYVRHNKAWVRQGAFDVGVASSAGEVDALSHQLFILDGTQDNTVSFTRLPEGRAMVLALVFRGQGGTLTWPDNLAWSQNEVPQLSASRTVITVLWDGETLTGTTALAV
ncbi:prophage tail fiber N-terminal domain-containing protein [Salmonella enterica subsp. enterica serovar Rubislaw]|nr:prophage tail fiber N-terminal domain-containing protein [Salmonella enterica subsp. enterica serovar Rubislaw]HDN4684892.1 prophage tail fiber N-terminal domain-containing protein [Salmonella enterica subsp. enterica serovar Ball]